MAVLEKLTHFDNDATALMMAVRVSTFEYLKILLTTYTHYYIVLYIHLAVLETS